jgi:hypothetical protein
MRRCLHKLLLILVTLSVAFAPLSGARALPDAGTTADTESHCAGMQHDMQQMDHDADHGSRTDNDAHKCKSGCNGSCCDKSCSTCLHAAVAIPASLIVLRHTPVHEHGLPVAETFPERHLKPPLRPPLALR